MVDATQKSPDQPSEKPLQPEKLNPIVYRILHEASPELAGYYLGAHITLEDVSNPERIPAAAHSLRELIEKVPDKHQRGVQIVRPPSVLSSITYAARDSWAGVIVDKTNQRWQLPDSDESNKFLRKSEKFWTWFTTYYSTRDEQRLRFIQKITKGVPLPSELQEKQNEQWGEYASRFTKIAHHREAPDDFYKLVSEFEDFLIRELDPQTTKDFARISELIKEFESGSEENLAELLRLVRSNRPNYDHFFESISSASWLKVLEDNELTSYVDDPLPAEEGGYILLPWAPAPYYEKIATDEPEKIASIIIKLPPTDNERAHRQMVQIASKMPREQAICIAPLLPGWIKGRFAGGRGLLPYEVNKYIIALTEMGAYDEAIEVFRALFELQPPLEADKYFRHPQTLTSDHAYKELLKEAVPALMELNPEGVIKELCDLLEAGLKFEERDSKKRENGLIYDGSSIWRPDIRDAKYEHEVNPILVTRIYKAIVSYADTVEKKLAVIETLTSYEFEIFHRIAATVAEDQDDKKLKAIYDELVKKVVPSHPDFVVSEGNVTPAVTLEEMKKLSADEIVKLLNTWDPQENLPGFGRSKSDIGHVLSQYVQEDPDILRQVFESEEKLNPEYQQYPFMGIRLASDNQLVAVDWEPIIKYGRELIEASNTHDSQGDERQTQSNIQNAIESGINQDHIKVISPEIAEQILSILLPLCSHVEPSPEDEVVNEDSNRRDSVGTAISSIRSEALNGLIALLKNVSRNGKELDKPALAEEQRNGIYGLLEKHLDIKQEPSLAVRTVFARELPFLAYDNQEWVKKNLDKLFPKDKDQERYFVDALEVFLEFTKTYPEVFPLVVPYFVEYMQRVQKGEVKGDNPTTINHAVAQPLFLFIDDYIQLEHPAVQELFKMPDAYLEEAMDFFGRGIKQTSGKRQKKLLKKAKEYWQARLDSGNVTKAEYSKFGWWFRASATDKWMKEHFSKALKETDQMDSLYFVADEIVELAKTDENGAADAILEILDTQHKDNLVNMLHTPELRETLKTLLTSNQVGVKEKAIRVIDKLCNMGFYNFKELLDEKTT